VESTFLPLDGGETALPYLNALAAKSRHITLRGLGADAGSLVIERMEEHPGKGVVAWAEDGTRIIAGKSDFLGELGLTVPQEPGASYVALGQKVVGRILRKSVYDERSRHFLASLLSSVPEAEVEIFSGDPMPGAGAAFTGIDSRIVYYGNLSPEEKAKSMRAPCAFVGDGLNDTLALAAASVSFRVGHRILGFAPVDFHLQRPDLNLLLLVIQYAKKYRRILIQTGCAAFFYNAAAFTLAAFGKFSPLGAVLAMLASFSLMLLSVLRLQRVDRYPALSSLGGQLYRRRTLSD
jgi:cation transport ATPase